MAAIPPISQPPGRPYGEPTLPKGRTELELGEGGERRRRAAEEGAAHRPWWRRIFRKEQPT